MSLFRKGSYRSNRLINGIRHDLRMAHPSTTDDGQWHAKCLNYGTVCKAATKGQADAKLAHALGVGPAPAPVAKPVPKAPKADAMVMHVPASEFNGKQYPERTFVFGLTEVCEALENDRARGVPSCPGSVRFIPGKPAVPGKFRAKKAKYEISPEALPDFWEHVNTFHVGQVLKIVDKIREVDDLLVTVGE
jgi:hypothetical protein